MPIVVTRNWEGESLPWNSSSGDSARRTYIVTGTDDALAARQADGIPRKGDSHPANGLLRVTGISPQRTGPLTWTVDVEWSIPKPNDGANNGNAKDPLDQLPRISWAPQTVQEGVDQDAYGNPLMNTAGDAYGEPANRERNVRILTVIRNEPFYDLRKAAMYENCVNSTGWVVKSIATVEILEAGTVRLQSYAPEGEYSMDVPPDYVVCRYQFLVDPLGHKVRRLNQGVSGWYADSSGKKKKHYLYVREQGSQKPTRVSHDVRLDAQGIPILKDSSGAHVYGVTEAMKTPVASPVPLPANVEIDSRNASVAIWLIHSVYPTIDFAGLGF